MRKNKKNIVFFLFVYGLAVLAPLHTTIESFYKEKTKSCELCDWIGNQNKVAKEILFSPISISFSKAEHFVVKSTTQDSIFHPSSKTLKGIFFRGPPTI